MRRSLWLACLVSVASASAVSAQGITLFGDARLGAGYNIRNNGQPDLETKESEAVAGEDVATVLGGASDLRAVSRVRFGVLMVGESDSGVNFGAQIRADNAAGGQGGADGQRAGNVFVTGNWGTLSFGDVDGADQSRVGTLFGNFSLTGLGDYNQLPFLSNGGGSDNAALQFVTDPEARPTMRYDYDLDRFGISVSTSRNLNDAGVGAGYTQEFEDGSISLGVGYYDFSSFTGDVAFLGAVEVPDGRQWAASIEGAVAAFRGGIAYTSIDAGAAGELDVVTIGGGATFGEWAFLGYYAAVTDGNALFGEALDGKDSYGASGRYDLGGGATLNAGIARTYGIDSIGTPGGRFAPEVERSTLADFGIRLTF